VDQTLGKSLEEIDLGKFDQPFKTDEAAFCDDENLHCLLSDVGRNAERDPVWSSTE
jgi:hypothetical protein